MKKALLFLAVLCVAGIFSAKAQSSSDSAFVRDLNYTFINTSSLPYSASASITTSDKILKDIRVGRRAKGYAIQVSGSKTLDITMATGGWDSYLYLLDANFNVVTYNDDNTGIAGSRIVRTLSAGQYYIIATTFSAYATLPANFSFSINEITVTPINSLTPTSLATLPANINDTLKSTDPFIDVNGEIKSVKLYSFQGTQNKIVKVAGSFPEVLLMDNNRNILKIGSTGAFAAQLSRAGTYYLAFVGNINQTSKVTISLHDYQTYYIDAINGSDATGRNGLTASTAFKTLDTAIARSQNIGRYYLTEDYTINTNNGYRVIYYGELLPYQKDIHLYATSSYPNGVAYAGSKMVVGENGGTYNFLIENTRFNSSTIFGGNSSKNVHVEVNNLKIRNSKLKGYIGYSDTLIIRNCEYTNDSVSNVLFYPTHTGKTEIINSTFSNDTFSIFISGYEYLNNHRIITMENITFNSNIMGEPQRFQNDSVVIKSGTWQNNNLKGNWSTNSNTNIINKNLAGFFLQNAVLDFGANFSMDMNNYICIDTISTVRISSNINAASAAQIYPFKMTRPSNSPIAVADYYEGRRLLSGSSSLLSNNYQKFSVAQADNSALWYLHPDGTIHTYNAGIAQAENADIRIFPNPASDKVTIELQNISATEICVMDIYGKTVVRQAINGQSEVLDLGNLAKGMYFVQIRNNSKVEATQKLVKK